MMISQQQGRTNDHLGNSPTIQTWKVCVEREIRENGQKCKCCTIVNFGARGPEWSSFSYERSLVAEKCEGKFENLCPGRSLSAQYSRRIEHTRREFKGSLFVPLCSKQSHPLVNSVHCLSGSFHGRLSIAAVSQTAQSLTNRLYSRRETDEERRTFWTKPARTCSFIRRPLSRC